MPITKLFDNNKYKEKIKIARLKIQREANCNYIVNFDDENYLCIFKLPLTDEQIKIKVKNSREQRLKNKDKYKTLRLEKKKEFERLKLLEIEFLKNKDEEVKI